MLSITLTLPKLEQIFMDAENIMASFFDVTNDMLGQLGVKRSVEIFRDLLWCQARRVGVPLSKIHITTRTNVPDGGVDAAIDEDAIEVTDDILVGGGTFYQIKSGATDKPWQKSWLQKELFGRTGGEISAERLGEAVRDGMDSGGRYVIVSFGVSPTPQQIRTGRKHLRELLIKCGYDSPKVEIWGQDHIVGFLASYPSLCLQVSNRGGFNFQSHASWGRCAEMARRLHIGEQQSKAIQEIRTYMRSEDIGHVRLIGEPGIGKTRLVLEALSSEDLAPYVLYIPYAEEFQKSGLFNEMLRIDSDLRAILVVDECPQKEKASIWNAIKPLSDRVRLVSIDHGPEEGRDEKMRTLYCPVLSEQQIVEIILEYIQSKMEAQRWAPFCGGSPRVAHVVGENLRSNPEDILKPIGTVDIWGRFICGQDDPNIQKVKRRTVVLRYLALFVKFGFEAPVDSEGRFIAELVKQADPNITWPEFQEIVHNLRQKRILQGKKTLFIVPKALHVYLWLDFWRNYGQSFSVSELLPRLPEGLRSWFARMFLYGHASQEATLQIQEVLGPNGPFSDESFTGTQFECAFLNTLAEADPKSTLSCIERTVGKWDDVKLEKFTEGRQYVVWALEKIAVWPEFFNRAATVLRRLAEQENSKYGNNATDTFVGLFSLAHGPLAPTTATPQQRFPVLEEVLDSDSESTRKIALKACKEALSTYHRSKMVGPEYQGIKPSVSGWMPQIWGEVFDAYRAVWRALVKRWSNWIGIFRREAADVLIESAIGLLGINSLRDEVLDTLDNLAEDKETDIGTLVRFIARQLRYYRDELDAKVIERLEEINTKIIGSSFKSRLRRFVLSATWEDMYDANGGNNERASLKITELAEEAIKAQGQLGDTIDDLVSGSNVFISTFGYELAKADENFMLYDTIRCVQIGNRERATTFLFGGYLRAMFEADIAKWETCIIRLLDDPSYDTWSMQVICQSGITDPVFEKLIGLWKDNRIDGSQFEGLRYSRDLTSISEINMESFVSETIDKNDVNGVGASLTLMEGYYCGKDVERKLPEELSLDLLCSGSAFTDGPNDMKGYYWEVLANKYIENYPDRAFELLANVFANMISYQYRFFSSNATGRKVIQKIIARDPSKAWDTISGNLTDLTTERAHITSMWFRPVGFDAKEIQPISDFPEDKILTWIDEEPEKRAPYVARFAPKAIQKSGPGTLTRELLVRYGNVDGVMSALHSNFWSGGWCGPSSKHFRKKRDEARNWLKGEDLNNVLTWLNEYINSLSSEIERSELMEEREF